MDLVLAVNKNETPDKETMLVLRAAFLQIFHNQAKPNAVFSAPRGRPPDDGFDPAFILSVFVTLRKREIARAGFAAAALERAKEEACASFVGFDGHADPAREVDRYWSRGREAARVLKDNDLRRILEPHIIP